MARVNATTVPPARRARASAAMLPRHAYRRQCRSSQHVVNVASGFFVCKAWAQAAPTGRGRGAQAKYALSAAVLAGGVKNTSADLIVQKYAEGRERVNWRRMARGPAGSLPCHTPRAPRPAGSDWQPRAAAVQ